MRLRACFERAADAGVISYAHCTEIVGCITEYESGGIDMDITNLTDDAREALDAVIVWIESEDQ